MKKYWGYHLMLDCRAGRLESVRSKPAIDAFVRDLVEQIDMKAFKEPDIEHFAEHDAEAAGYTLIQMIETSAITAHFVDINGDFYLDIFSCKDFDPDAAKAVVDAHFAPEAITANFFKRSAR